MNKHIKQLIENATIRGEEYLPGNDGHPTPTFYFDREKFAELIVNECAQVANQNFDKGFCPVGGFIKDHFGIK